MNTEYDSPAWRQAALMRAIHSRRTARFLPCGRGTRTRPRAARSRRRCGTARAPADVALGLLEDLLAALARLGAALCAWHVSGLLCVYRYGTSALSRGSSAFDDHASPCAAGAAAWAPCLSSLWRFQPRALELARSGPLQPLRRGPLGFHLRHASESRILIGRLGSAAPLRPRRSAACRGPQSADALGLRMMWSMRPSMRGLFSATAMSCDGLHHLLEHLPAELGVGHLAALEAHRHLGLVAFLQEPPHVLQLEVEVVPLGLGAHLHFLTGLSSASCALP